MGAHRQDNILMNFTKEMMNIVIVVVVLADTYCDRIGDSSVTKSGVVL